MAKTKGPLMSLDAHGSFGRVLTYSHRKSGRQVRTYNKPLVEASAKQRGQRRLTEFLVAQWQNMSAGDKATWEANARLSGPNITGYHYFLREAQRDLYTHTGLCGYWHCNEIVGGKVLDLSGNANHGTLEPGYPANAPVLVDSYKTRFSKGLLYDGVDEYVDCGNKAAVNITDAITLIAWIEISKVNAHQDLISKFTWAGAANNAGYILRLDIFNRFIFSVYNNSKDEILTPITYTTGWHMVAGVWTPTTKTIYVDMVKTTAAATIASIKVSPVNLGLGGTVIPTNLFGGKNDEVCIYNRGLSEAELNTQYRFAMREVD